MAQFGYLCSPYCQEQARRKELPVPVYAGQKSVMWKKEVQTGNRFVASLAVAAGLAVVALGVYKFWLSRPKVAFTFATSKAVPFVHAEFLGADRILAATAQRVSVREWQSDREVWSFALTPPAGAASTPAGGPGGGIADSATSLASPGDAQVRVVNGDVWVANHSTVVRLDAASGSKKAEVKLPSGVDQISMNDDGVTAVASAGEWQRHVTRVDFKTGQSTADVVKIPVARRRPVAAGGDLDTSAPPPPPDSRVEILPSGSGAVGLVARLIEARIVQRDAVKPKGRSVMEKSGGPSAADSLDAAAEFMNENQAPVTEDQSLYQVSVRRLFGNGIEWSGSVTGTPSIYPLKTLDLLVAGTSVTALDRNNRKLWEARLNYAIGPRFNAGYIDPDEEGEFGGQPAVESGSRVYFFDQGTLTAFDSRDGRVAWRLPSVGVSRVVPAGSALYLVTTSAGPESIQYSKDITLNEKIVKIVQKVDAATGRVLWSQERLGDEPRTSGKFVYVAMKKSYLMDGVGGGDTRLHYYLRRVDPGDGKTLWEYYQRGVADEFEARENLLLLRFPDEIKILKFLSL